MEKSTKNGEWEYAAAAKNERRERKIDPYRRIKYAHYVRAAHTHFEEKNRTYTLILHSS